MEVEMATAVAASPDLMTADEFMDVASSFDVPVELVRGEIVEMSQPTPPHGTICSN